jgi:hypothetical protein
MAAADPQDPRFRPYRMAMWALYLVVAVGFSTLIIISVFSSVLKMSPSFPAAKGDAAPVSECLQGTKSLFAELEAGRQGLIRKEPVTTADLAWVQFRQDWVTRAHQLKARCAVDQPGREKLADVFKHLDEALNLYTTATVQFAGGVGPTVDALHEAMRAAEQ